MKKGREKSHSPGHLKITLLKFVSELKENT
jgi:hypothetical protein